MFRTCETPPPTPPHPPPTPPVTGPILIPGTSYEQSWYKSTRICYIPNIKALCLLVSEKIFKDFAIFIILVAMATRVMTGIQSLEQLW